MAVRSRVVSWISSYLFSVAGKPCVSVSGACTSKTRNLVAYSWLSHVGPFERLLLGPRRKQTATRGRTFGIPEVCKRWVPSGMAGNVTLSIMLGEAFPSAMGKNSPFDNSHDWPLRKAGAWLPPTWAGSRRRASVVPRHKITSEISGRCCGSLLQQRSTISQRPSVKS